MTVLRIVANIEATDPQAALVFYGELLGLDIVMDHGWILTFASGEQQMAQVSIASQGGSGTEVPQLSIEVDNVDAVYSKAKQLGLEIVYDITDEPWGVRRFYVRDPFGTIVNILAHRDR